MDIRSLLSRRGLAAGLATALILATGGSCGSRNSSPSAPSNPVAATTITIANNAASPKDIVVTQGSQVTFVNNDTREHGMFSDPHPIHTDCPEINQAGYLSSGQSRQTGNLNTVRTCGFHDHLQPEVTGLQGTITIQ